MAVLVRWQQTWNPAGPGLVWLEGWTEAWPLGSVTLATTGHQGITGNTGLTVAKDIGSGTMGMVGHTTPTTQGLSYPTEFVPSISGTVPSVGHAGLTGGIDFEEPIFLDPPLQLVTVSHLGLTATVTYMINKSIGVGALTATAHAGAGTAVLGWQTAVIKQLFSLSIPVGGRTSLVGSIGTTSVKTMGAGSMGMSGRSTIVQSGFQIQAPAPYTYPLGSLTLSLIGDTSATGDTSWTDQPPHDMGSGDIGISGHMLPTVGRLFAGGLWEMPSLLLATMGRIAPRSGLSYPGETYPDTEAVAVYEGLDMQESFADFEGDGVSIQ